MSLPKPENYLKWRFRLAVIYLVSVFFVTYVWPVIDFWLPK